MASRLKKTQPDINTQPTKTNSDIENERNEFSSENVDNDVEIRAVDPHLSFTKGLQEIDTQNNSDSESEDKSVSEESNLDETEQTGDPNTNNIIKIRLFARTDSIVIFLTQDGEPCDGSHLLVKDNRVPAIKNATLGKARVIKQVPHSPSSKNQSFRPSGGKISSRKHSILYTTLS